MKRIVIMLLIACSATITASAQQKKATADNTPYNVKVLLNNLINSWGAPSDEVYSVQRNPNTNQIESSVKITYFVANVNTGSVRQNMSAIGDAFKKDESRAYQLLHLAPGNKESFSLKAVDENGQSKSYLVRGADNEEMWLLCAKNPENPKLRDAYAIKWTMNNDKSKALGAIYQITSLRPDMYEKPLDNSKKTFKIVGRVAPDIKDSLYNIYIANTAEELERIGDDDYVACVPVINKRFEWQTELDHPVVGRLRCIFPDGELCSAWINLDFVPGETYRITVHNGYYDEDKDYERRVGRQSGKSLLNSRQSRGIDDIVEDTVLIDTIPGYNDSVTPRQSSTWEPSPEQKMQVEVKGMALKANMEALKATYKSLEPYYKMKSLTGTDLIFEQITKLNKQLDAKFQDFIKYLNGLDVPPTEKAKKSKAIGEIHKEILKFYTEQNQAFTELYKEVGVLTKAAQKTQKYVNGITERYLKEMSKMVMGAE